MEAVPYSLSIQKGAWFDLTGSRAVFRLSGPDRVRFLNGQVTNNVAVDLSEKSIPACLCSLKGKVEALVWITEEQDGEALLIDGELDQREQLFERLDRYLIADDCELEDVTDNWRLFHQFDGTGGRLTDRVGIDGSDRWVKSGEPSGLNVENAIDVDVWGKLSVLSGFPEAGCEITGNEFPSDLGLDRWAVDFRKGCYLGQEIVSRIESVGKTKKTLVVLKTKTPLKQCEDIVVSGVKMGSATRDSVEIEKNIWIVSALLLTDLVEPLVTEHEEDRLRVFAPNRVAS